MGGISIGGSGDASARAAVLAVAPGPVGGALPAGAVHKVEGIAYVQVIVAVAVQVCPDALVPCEDRAWFSRIAVTVLPDAVPWSMPNSFQAKFPSAVPNVADTVHVRVPPIVNAPDTSW